MTNDGDQPPADIFPGAVDRGSGCVTFALYAPGKQAVSLIGDFNGWDRGADRMRVTPAGLWWIEKELPPGIHEYQFAVTPAPDGSENEVVVCDPYARGLIDDSAYDPPRAALEVGRPPYRWQHDGWQRPPFPDLILYELHVGDFTPEGTFRAVTERLDYLRDLGINALELMPVFEFKGDLGWGYNPAYFFTVEKSYGEADDLCELIDQAHALGIAVILDMVLAHTAHRHPYNKLYPYEESPWYGPGCGEPNQFGFPTLDYTKGPAQDFSRDVETFWLNEFHVDGFRYDYCLGIGCKGDLGMPHLVNSARAVRPDIYLIGEYSPEKTDQVNACGLDGAWHVGGSYGLKALLCEGECGEFNSEDFESCIGVLDPWDYGYAHAAEMVNFLESHDEQRTINDMYSCGFDEETARYKSALGATILFTMPGEPMLYHGQELGEGTPRKTNERNTLHWELLETPGGKGLHEHYRKLAWLRRQHPALRSETYCLDAASAERKTLTYHRWNEAGDEMVVAVNFAAGRQALTVPFPHAGRWRDVIGDRTLKVEGESFDLELEGSSAAVFVKA